MIKNVALLMAMDAEAQPVIQALGLQYAPGVINERLPMRCYSGCCGTVNVWLIVSGTDQRYGVDNIGSEAATLMAYEAMVNLQPDIVISAGTAGGFASRGAEIGTVYVSDRCFVFHDRHVPLPGFDRSAIGEYPALNVRHLALALGLPRGVISTGSSLQKSTADIAVIEAHQAVAKEMEAAAVAWVAMLFDTPVMALKSITNLLDEDNSSEREFSKNLDVASLALKDKVVELIAYLENKSIKQLAR